MPDTQPPVALQRILEQIFGAELARPFNVMHREAIARRDAFLRSMGADTQALAARLTEAAADVLPDEQPLLDPTAVLTRPAYTAAVIAPRGAAKSTLFTELFTLMDLVFGTEKFVLIFSATQNQAETRIANMRARVARNPVLRAVLGLGLKDNPQTATACALQVRGIRAEAYGAQREIRGLSHDSVRPTRVILDDVDTDDTAFAPERARKTLRWFRNELMPAGDTFTQTLAVGTLVHGQSLLAHIGALPSCELARYPVILKWSARPDLWDEWERLYTAPAPGAADRAEQFLADHRAEMMHDTRVLWPEHQNYELLMRRRAEMSHAAFAAEMMNEPRAATGATPVMDVDRWTRFRLMADGACVPALPDGTWDPVATVEARELRVLTYIDPAGGTSGATGDFAAIVTVGFCGEGAAMRAYILDARLMRAGVRRQAETAVEIARRHNARLIVHERTGALDMSEFLEEACGESAALPTRCVTHTTSKLRRAARFETLLASPALHACITLPTEFLEQCRNFGMGLRCHDDAPDALIGALEVGADDRWTAPAHETWGTRVPLHISMTDTRTLEF